MFEKLTNFISDSKAEIYIGTTIEEPKIILIKRRKKWNIDIEEIALGIILNLLVSILVMLILLKVLLIL